MKLRVTELLVSLKNMLMYKNLLTMSAMYLLKNIYAQNWQFKFMKITIWKYYKFIQEYLQFSYIQIYNINK
jgi:hypothetical protein